ncbi:Maf-like protein [Haloimpatiens sp. FM7330]|uniref:Maf-like protein n=1 Tax=Haloimpatiens sp. FM7330 TaxID=3298610 RepID=UPI00363866E6
MKLTLGSASPRRKELLKKITENFDVIVSDFDEESIDFNGDFTKYVKKIAEGKALNVSKKIQDESIVIGCDTIVAFDGKVLGKPKDEEDAYSMLSAMSGKWHAVYSGIAIVNNLTGKILTDYVCTNVKFSDITDREIKKYIKTGEPMDKAGSYGIQGLGGIFIEKIDGCYYNVVGLPINKLNSMFMRMGVNLI